MLGGAGGDSITGGGGSDAVSGGLGDDIVYGGVGNDTLDGGVGNDTLGSDAGIDLFYGDIGDDVITGGGSNDIAHGGRDSDVVYGNKNDDLIYGNQQNDTLYGGQNSDTVFGGQNEDAVFGNKGADVVYGNKGSDVVFGGQGNDVAYGGQADKTGQEHGEYNALWQRLGPALGLRRQVFTPSRGEALIWAANLLHGGYRQKDRARSRHSQVTHYYFADCTYYTPFLSDPFLGRIQFREITDIRTNRIVPNRYAGRDIAPRLIQDLHPDRGINPRAAGATIGTAEDDPFSPAKTDWVACAGRHRFENSEPNAAKIEGRRIFLHPNPGESPPARLILENLPVPANATAAAVVTVTHAEAAAVRFRTFTGPAGSALADLTPCGECVCAAGERLSWETSLPNAAGEVTLVIETAMAAPRARNNYAWAYVEGLRLI